MIQFTLTHEIDTPADAFWTTFFSKDFNEKLYGTELAFPEFTVVSLEHVEGDVRRVVDAIPKLAMMPPVVMKLLGSGFRYREEGTLDRARGVFTWKIIPSVLADKIRTDGTVKVERISDTRCRRLVDITIEAKIFGVGGVVESSTEKTYRDAWERSAAFMNRYLATHA